MLGITEKGWYVLSVIVHWTHIGIIGINTFAALWILSVFPWFVGCMIITLLLSPFVGGDRCILNHIENYCRLKAGLDPIIF